MTCDAAGRLGQFFVADGVIKLRLTTSNGNQIFVGDNLVVVRAAAAAAAQLELLAAAAAAARSIRRPMGNTAAGTLSGVAFQAGQSTQPGSAGGANSTTLLVPNLPPYTPSGTITNGAITITGSGTAGLAGVFSDITPGSVQGAAASSLGASQATSTFTGTAQGGTSSAFPSVPRFILGTVYWKL
jgi:hypothetical protein